MDWKDPQYLAQGWGALVGRMYGDATWAAEQARLVGPLLGTSAAAPVDVDAKQYAVALSYCSQHLWGSWSSGAWNPSVTLPNAMPRWPSRTAFVEACEQLRQPPRQPYVTLYGDPEA
jgi:hypothetical protein